MSTDLHTLSGAYAIDALSAEEAAEFRTHLEGCQACRDEVRELQAAAGIMGASEATAPPAGLKARVLAAADQAPQLPPKITPISAARSYRWLPRMVAVAILVLVVLVGGVTYVIVRNNEPGPAAAVTQVFDAPDAHHSTVVTSNGGKVSVATSKKLGEMAVNTGRLPKLGGRQVYQLWAMAANQQPVSAGVLSDVRAGRAMAMPAPGTRVAITIEPAGGSRRPTSNPIVTVNPGRV
jgi:anti-sigma-K factor RskA